MRQMAKDEYLKILDHGVEAWNKWREDNPKVKPDLSGDNVDLYGKDFDGANFSYTDFSNAHLEKTTLRKADLYAAKLCNARLLEADLSKANLEHANLYKAHCRRAVFRGASLKNAILIETDLQEAELNSAYLNNANLSKAKLLRANLSNAYLQRAILHETNMRYTNLIDTNLERAELDACEIYGISAWGLEINGATQTNLILTIDDQASVTVDNLATAQFIYLLLKNENMRDVINSTTRKLILILGDFKPRNKAILNAIKKELAQKYKYVPIIFDFEKPESRNLTETVMAIAHLARFVIADITDAGSVADELARITSQLKRLPVQPLLRNTKTEYGLFRDLTSECQMLPIYRYRHRKDLLVSLAEKVIAPAEAKAIELQQR